MKTVDRVVTHEARCVACNNVIHHALHVASQLNPDKARLRTDVLPATPCSLKSSAMKHEDMSAIFFSRSRFFYDVKKKKRILKQLSVNWPITVLISPRSCFLFALYECLYNNI